MNAQNFWELFLETGSPELYVLYSHAKKVANELGINDMSGNVSEWCQDWYGAYSSSPQNNPTGPSTGSSRVYRGGNWNSAATGCRSSDRNCNAPSDRSGLIGLRLAL